MSKSLEEFGQIVGVLNKPDAELIKIFAWYLHTERNQAYFSGADIAHCYDTLHLPRASNYSHFLKQLEKKKEVLHNSQGYKLSKAIRDSLDLKYRLHPITIQTRKLLRDLPAKMPSTEEREFLRETIMCYEHNANRAAIVMVWNLAYDHLCHYVVKNELASFNTTWPKRFPKKHTDCKISAISKREDFSEIQEADVIDICRSANIVTADVYKVLKIGLDTRNSAAHPSNVTFEQVQVEALVISLINNVVSALKT